ncbi:Alpha-mannosidase 2x, partial [Orchesella cincta]
RTASLTQHNIVFTALGGDFRFEEALEWEQQYSNYRKLFDYINSRPEQYHSTAQFGTLRHDVIFAFSPSYWSGFYGTRPFWKQLIREVEDELRKTEIIFTFSYNLLKQRNHPEEVIGHNYDNLVQARRSVALFQHHDGVTGTSPRTTMLDYSKKLTQAWNFLKQIQKVGIEAIWKHELKMEIPPLAEETSRKNHTHTGQKNPIKLYENTSVVKKVLLYNSLGWKIPRLVRLVVETLNVTVKGPGGEEVLSQINLKYDPGSHEPTNQSYELVFVAKLPPLSVVTYEISQQVERPNITLENSRFLAHFNSVTGMLEKLQDKLHKVDANVTLSFGKYHACLGGGAYLLKVCDPSPDWILNKGRDKPQVVLYRGPVISQLVVFSGRLKISAWIINTNDSEILSTLFMENEVGASKYKTGEYFMRFQTDLVSTQTSNESENSQPVFFTDTNGHAVEKRVTVDNLPYQANHYPMTHFAFIQDDSAKMRFTV